MKKICTLDDRLILGREGISCKPPRLTVRAIVKTRSDRHAMMYSERFDLYTPFLVAVWSRGRIC